MESPILGSQNQARSPNAADAAMINLFPEVVSEGQTSAYLQSAPGLVEIADVNVGPIRGCTRVRGRAFFVSGLGFYELNSDYTTTFYGNVTGSDPVTISDNGFELFITCNPDAFLFDTATNTLAQITDPDFVGAATGAYIDGYFIFNEPNTGRVWSTELLQGAVLEPTHFATAEGSPDNVQVVMVQNKESWFIGTDTTEVWANEGLIDFPLAPIPRAFLETGTPAPYSAVKMPTGIIFLAADERGQGCVVMTQGYGVNTISTPQIDWLIQQVTDLSGARAFSYQQDGHVFYVLNIPGLNYALAYDATIGVWHLRSGFQNGEDTRYRAACQMSYRGRTIVGDYENGKLYRLDLTAYTDAGVSRRWLRRWRALPPDSNPLKYSSHHSLQIRMEAGVGVQGLDPPVIELLAAETGDVIITESSVEIEIEQTPGAAVSPEVALRWSDDGGHSWSNYHRAKLGRIGQTGTRVQWHRLGATLALRDRVYEVSSAAPVKIAIQGAVLQNVFEAD